MMVTIKSYNPWAVRLGIYEMVPLYNKLLQGFMEGSMEGALMIQKVYPQNLMDQFVDLFGGLKISLCTSP
jgi:hypothetical protein